MQESKSLEILKNAILLEKRGEAFYGTSAGQTKHTAVKQFFEAMAAEEREHIRILSDQYAAYLKNRKFAAGDYPSAKPADLANDILNQELKEKISAAGFESAAISAAIAMEERAVSLYAKQADATDDPEEKKLYKWLSEWESGHLDMLLKMDTALREKIWNDNQFWPF